MFQFATRIIAFRIVPTYPAELLLCNWGKGFLCSSNICLIQSMGSLSAADMLPLDTMFINPQKLHWATILLLWKTYDKPTRCSNSKS